MNSNINLTRNQSDPGFLCGFLETSAEMPPDGLNGECVIHYGGDHRKYEMIVTLVDGMRNGRALLAIDGVPYMNLEYRNGVLTGKVERLNQYGIVDLRGRVTNGVESGLFQEYDDNKRMTWRGYYRNGQRYSEVVKSEKRKGYYEERSADNGSLLSVAQYDRSLHNKNGHCLEYEDGEWIGEWIYENGVRKLPVREYSNGVLTLYDTSGKKMYEGKFSKREVKDGFYEHEPMEGMNGYCKEVNSNNQIVTVAEYDPFRMKKNGKCFELKDGMLERVCLYQSDAMVRVLMKFNGSTMTEYYDNRKKAYTGGFKGSMKNGIVRAGDGREYILPIASSVDGLVTEKQESKTLVGKWKNGKKNGVFYEIDGAGNVKRKCLFRNDELIQVSLEFDGSIMTEYDKRGKRRYVGGFIGDMDSGFVKEGNGSEYRGDSRVAVYTGQWKNGKRSGKGTEYRHGRSVYSGYWIFGMYSWLFYLLVVIGILIGVVIVVVSSVIGIYRFYNLRIDDCGQLNRISRYRSNRVKSLVFKKDGSCKVIEIGDQFFGRIRLVELDGVHELERIVIGKKCFSRNPVEPWKSKQTDGSYRIANCLKLKSIQIGDYSFSDYHSFELNNLPSLQSIQIGTSCFYRTSTLSLNSRNKMIIGT